MHSIFYSSILHSKVNTVSYDIIIYENPNDV